MAAIKACFGLIRVCVYIWLNPCLLGPSRRDTTTGDKDNCRTVYFFVKAVAVQGDLGGISSFDIHGDPTTVGASWKKWKHSFKLFACGKGVTDAAEKKALLLCILLISLLLVSQVSVEMFTQLQSNSWTTTYTPQLCSLRKAYFSNDDSITYTIS